jgi:hypothetical protein
MDQLREPASKLADQDIPRHMAEHVVHLLEAVEIKRQERELVAAPCANKGQFKPFIEQAAVRQPCEHVMRG